MYQNRDTGIQVIRARQDDLFAEIVLELRPEVMGTRWSAEELTSGVADG